MEVHCVCRWICMPSFSRGAICLPLDDQKNIICTLPLHIAPHGGCMRRQGAHRAPTESCCKACKITPFIWATSRENLFLPYANNKGADQPAHPCSLISIFIVCCLYSIISLVSISEISSLQLASVAVQASSSLSWSQTPKTGFLVTRLI